MPWKLIYHPETKVVETFYQGVMPPEELQTAIQATLSAVRQQSTSLILSDCTELVGGHSLSDLYGLITLLESLGFAAALKEALIMPVLDAPAKDVEFWEQACRNRGIEARIFKTKEAGLEWLLGDSN